MGVYYPFTDPDAFVYEPTGISTQFTGSYNPNEAANFDNGLKITGISTFSGNVTIDAGTSTTLTIRCDDTGQAGIRLYGNTQGTGYVEVGQSSSYGGGISYNGDGSPGFVTGETDDHITFYGLNNGTRTEVFYYAYNSTGDVNFNGAIVAAGNVTAFSDINLKKDIEVISNALDKVSQIRGLTFNRTDIECDRQSGVIAQEVEEVLPEVVTTNEKGIKSVAYGNMVGLLIEAIKDLKGEVETLKDEIKSLKKENN